MESTYELLARLAREEYRPSGIPGPEDASISAAMTSAGSAELFRELAARIDFKIGRILNAFASRMAMMALRSRDSSQIVQGLIAAQLAMMVDDDRDILPSYAMLYRSAEEIGVDAAATFRSASLLPGTLLCETPSDFASRSPEHRGIEAMGMTLVDGPDGAVYQSKPW